MKKSNNSNNHLTKEIWLEELGAVFTFGVVTINNSGTIINFTPGSARQKIEDLGNGIKFRNGLCSRGKFSNGVAGR
ncbi:hypothetical protein [Hydrocoleum sp. CS-953]|uniref:hypothetical protein n=1 Tax=Microcoleaceae TaxID=1892252 RepID=UPI000B9ACE10|nr:hypothetical protein [Hydrocoleum sp. CS-953]OZH55237.1 hypothetical protein AFK68_05905 [Hydrocoleum sp. CS-953]